MSSVSTSLFGEEVVIGFRLRAAGELVEEPKKKKPKKEGEAEDPLDPNLSVPPHRDT